MKKLEKIVLGLILFLPVSISIYFGKNWQESLLLLLASVAFILLINIEKYEILKLSKDGIEIKTKIMELDLYLGELKKMLLIY